MIGRSCFAVGLGIGRMKGGEEIRSPFMAEARAGLIGCVDAFATVS